MKGKDVKLYNVLFPLWMLLLFPQVWLIVLPGNFIIDSLIFLISMSILKLKDKKQFYKKHIFKIFIFGMLSDFAGAIYMLVAMIALQIGNMGDELYLTLPALLLSAICIFVLNYFVTFKGMDKKKRLFLALTFTIATAPYTFLVPSSWIY